MLVSQRNRPAGDFGYTCLLTVIVGSKNSHSTVFRIFEIHCPTIKIDCPTIKNGHVTDNKNKSGGNTFNLKPQVSNKLG